MMLHILRSLVFFLLAHSMNARQGKARLPPGESRVTQNVSSVGQEIQLVQNIVHCTLTCALYIELVIVQMYTELYIV